jgi:cob(I)alamin adenosyltransferase
MSSPNDDIVVRLDRIYTRGGDLGETSLGDGHRVAKHNARVAAYGTVDELNDLFDVGADLCVPPPPEDDEKHRSRLRVSPDQVQWLEDRIDEVNGALPPLTSFVVPGGTPLSAFLHVARTICRRAERDAVALAATEPMTPEVITYLNRLSDLLFVLARAANGDGGETTWRPGANRR